MFSFYFNSTSSTICLVVKGNPGLMATCVFFFLPYLHSDFGETQEILFFIIFIARSNYRMKTSLELGIKFQHRSVYRHSAIEQVINTYIRYSIMIFKNSMNDQNTGQIISIVSCLFVRLRANEVSISPRQYCFPIIIITIITSWIIPLISLEWLKPKVISLKGKH